MGHPGADPPVWAAPTVADRGGKSAPLRLRSRSPPKDVLFAWCKDLLSHRFFSWASALRPPLLPRLRRQRRGGGACGGSTHPLSRGVAPPRRPAGRALRRRTHWTTGAFGLGVRNGVSPRGEGLAAPPPIARGGSRRLTPRAGPSSRPRGPRAGPHSGHARIPRIYFMQAARTASPRLGAECTASGAPREGRSGPGTGISPASPLAAQHRGRVFYFFVVVASQRGVASPTRQPDRISS